jgi:hypothetical protein
MPQDKNFTGQGTLAEANEIRLALQERKTRLEGRLGTYESDQAEKESIGRIDKLLRVDF